MKKKVPRKSSLSITLAFIGAAALSCGESGYRQMYKTKEDCLADWNSPEKCEQAPQGSSGHYYPGMYYGPFMRGSYLGSGTNVQSRSVGSTNVTRGGFGSTSSFHSSGG
jgi:uncharacterized protein YgiB involved in biofilm formation